MSERATRVKWPDIARAARETSEALAGEGWVVASIRARVLLADLADEVDRLAGERDALLEACRGLLTCSLPRDISGQRSVDAALAAIAKAGGEA